MAATIWSKFFWSDWADDRGLQLSSFAAQGLWMRMLCIAAAANPTGYVSVNGNALDETGIARLTGAGLSEVADLLGELERNGVFSRDRKGCIYSRRMVADAKKRAIAQKNGRNGGNPTLCYDDDNPPSDNHSLKGGDKPQEPTARSQSKNIPPKSPKQGGAPRRGPMLFIEEAANHDDTQDGDRGDRGDARGLPVGELSDQRGDGEGLRQRDRKLLACSD